MKYTVEIPEELIPIITEIGYDLNSWFNHQCVDPLFERYKGKIQAEKLKQFEGEISEKVSAIRSQITINDKKVEEVPQDVVVEEPEIEEEPQPKPEPVEEPPVEEEPVTEPVESESEETPPTEEPPVEEEPAPDSVE